MKYAILIIFSSIFIFSCNTTNSSKVELDVIKAIEKSNNIYVVFSDEFIKQLTYNESDTNPIHLKQKNQILFIRDRKETTGFRDYIRKQIMTVDINTLKEKVITEKKPYRDGMDNSSEILTVGHPTLSVDSTSLFFTTEKWATSNQLVEVNIETGLWTELFAAGQYQLITKGVFKGNFLVSKSEIRDKGRMAYFYILNKNGEIVKEFANEDVMNKFSKEFI